MEYHHMKLAHLVYLGASAGLMACNITGTLVTTGTAPIPSPTVFPSELPSASPSGPVVCGVSGSPTVGTPVSGVVASMKYLPANSYSFNSGNTVIADECNWENPTSVGCPDGLNLDYAYMDANGISSDDVFYFPNVDVVPQEFLLGFPTAGGGTVKDNDGNVLTSYFSMDFLSQIQLAPGQPAGWYQFATLSDDGSVLNLDLQGNGVLTPIVNNDYWHGAIMQCSSQAVYMTPGQTINMNLQYFQGAPVSIAMMILWRQVASENPPYDPFCSATSISVDANGDPELNSIETCTGIDCANMGGPNYFTESANGSTQNSLFNNLLSSGGTGNEAWQVLNSDNYLLPATWGPNPCVTPSPSPSPSPSPTCTGPNCGGGSIGI
jgi:hypothetical protein